MKGHAISSALRAGRQAQGERRALRVECIERIAEAPSDVVNGA